MIEVWVPCLGVDGYAVSNKGNVKALPKIDSKNRSRKERHLVLTTTIDGYKATSFFKNGRQRKKMVHRLVYEAFVGPIPEKHEINHLNGIRDDNRPENLEAITHANNVKYSKDVLGADYATYGNGRMTTDQRSLVFELRNQGLTFAAIGLQLGFSKRQILNVWHGKCWKIN